MPAHRECRIGVFARLGEVVPQHDGAGAPDLVVAAHEHRRDAVAAVRFAVFREDLDDLRLLFRIVEAVAVENHEVVRLVSDEAHQMSEQFGFLVYVVEDQNRVVLVALVPRREGRQRHPDRVAELLFVAAVVEYLLRAGPVVVFRAGAEVFQPDLVDRPVGDHHALVVTPHGLQPVGFGSDLDPAAAGDVGDPHDRHGVGGGVLQVGLACGRPLRRRPEGSGALRILFRRRSRRQSRRG